MFLWKQTCTPRNREEGGKEREKKCGERDGVEWEIKKKKRKSSTCNAKKSDGVHISDAFWR